MKRRNKQIHLTPTKVHEDQGMEGMKNWNKTRETERGRVGGRERGRREEGGEQMQSEEEWSEETRPHTLVCLDSSTPSDWLAALGSNVLAHIYSTNLRPCDLPSALTSRIEKKKEAEQTWEILHELNRRVFTLHNRGSFLWEGELRVVVWWYGGGGGGELMSSACWNWLK